MVISPRGDLRRVRDHQDLGLPRQPLEAGADGVRGGSADAPVDLVENQRPRAPRAREDDLQGQHDPAELAARRHLGERTRLVAGVRGDPEGDAIESLVSPPVLGDRLDRGPDHGVSQPQRRQFRVDGLVEPPGAGAPLVAQDLRRLLVGRPPGLGLCGQTIDLVGPGVERREPPGEGVQDGRQFRHRRPVLARHRAKVEQPALDDRQPCRVSRQLPIETFEQRDRLHGLDARALENGHGFVEPARRVLPRPLQRPFGATQPDLCAVFRRQRRQRLRKRPGEAFRVHQNGSLGGEGVLLRRPGVEGAQLLDDVAHVLLVGARALQCRPRVFQGARRVPHRVERRRDLLDLRLQAGVLIEKPAMIGGIEQQGEIVLSLHLDDGHAELAQERGGDRPIVGEGPASTVGRDHAPKDHVIQSGQALSFEQAPRGVLRRNLENGGDVGLPGPGANQTRRCPAPEAEPQRVEQDRLAGPGFAREHAQARFEFQVETFDEDEVPDGQPCEHRAAR